MFSKKGFEDYFNQLYHVEESMADQLKQVLPHLRDEHIINQLKLVLADEERHKLMVEHVRKLFK